MIGHRQIGGGERDYWPIPVIGRRHLPRRKLSKGKNHARRSILAQDFFG